MTSNLGSDLISAGGTNLPAQLRDLVRKTFKPEFINRVDQIIVFDPLTPNQIERIVDLQLNEVQKRLDKQNIKLDASTSAKKLLAKLGYDPNYGARPLKRAIQDHILDELALRLIEGKIKSGSTIRIDAAHDKIVLN